MCFEARIPAGVVGVIPSRPVPSLQVALKKASICILCGQPRCSVFWIIQNTLSTPHPQHRFPLVLVGHFSGLDIILSYSGSSSVLGLSTWLRSDQQQCFLSLEYRHHQSSLSGVIVVGGVVFIKHFGSSLSHPWY